MSTTTTELTEGAKIRDWLITGLLGSGSYGIVYKVQNLQNRHQIAALKYDYSGEPESLKGEVVFLKWIKKTMRLNHFLEIFDAGLIKFGNAKKPSYYLSMELMYKGIDDFQRYLWSQLKDPMQYSLEMALRVGIQSLRGIYELHRMGILHRDLKVENLGIDIQLKNVVVILDFNMSRFYTSGRSRFSVYRSVRIPRSKTLCRGTNLLLSFTAEQLREEGRVGDLWSWLYTVCEIRNHKLPWDKYSSKYRTLHWDPVMKSILYPSSNLLKGCPAELYSIKFHLETLNYESCPDYCFLFQKLQEALTNLKIDPNKPTIPFI